MLWYFVGTYRGRYWSRPLWIAERVTGGWTPIGYSSPPIKRQPIILRRDELEPERLVSDMPFEPCFVLKPGQTVTPLCRLTYSGEDFVAKVYPDKPIRGKVYYGHRRALELFKIGAVMDGWEIE